MASINWYRLACLPARGLRNVAVEKVIMEFVIECIS